MRKDATPLTNTQMRYGSVAKTLHWTTAFLILTMLPLGFIATKLAEATQSGSPVVSIETLTTLFSLHKSIGVLVVFVAVARIMWALTQKKPASLHPERTLETLAAETVHWLLYASILLVPLTGWIHHAASSGFAPIWGPFGQSLPLVPKSEHLSELFSQLHFTSILIMGGALALHIAGALKHQWIDRDATLARMLPGQTATNTYATSLPDPAPQASQHLTLIHYGSGALAGLILATVFFAPLTSGTPHDRNNSTPIETAATTHTATPPAEVATSQPSTQVLPVWELQQGTLALEIKQLGNAVTGRFETWNAAIQYDPTRQAGEMGNVLVEIDIASLTLGTVTAQALGADYFDASTHPKAVFEATLSQEDGALIAAGALTIKNITIPLRFPVTLTTQGTTAEASGSFQLDRRDFNIGQTVPDEKTLGFTVDLTFDLTAKRQ
jgi:cytochrome b561/polyisoprenoid-binding protein YceI